MRTNFRSLTQILPRSVFLQTPSGAPMGKVPLQVLKELKHKARQNLSTINFAATFAKAASTCNTTMGKCQDSLKSTFKRIKSQIQKGANPDKAARCGYENACDYFEMFNKRILIQQRALACLSKSLAHILQRELYTMGNTGLLRREAEMTLLQPHLWDSRCQELRNSPFCPTQGDEGMETPAPNYSSLSSPVGGRHCSFRRDWLTNKYSNIITNGYILPFISKQKLARVPLIQGYKALQKTKLRPRVSSLFCLRMQ